jgi:hypothetical protein
MTNKNAEPLLPVELGVGKVKFAQGIKAGRWVFATGVMAQDFKNGIAPDVLSERAPHAGLPKREKEALRIWENIDAVLRPAGTDRTNLVRTDQYYATVKAVPAYQRCGANSWRAESHHRPRSRSKACCCRAPT